MRGRITEPTPFDKYLLLERLHVGGIDELLLASGAHPRGAVAIKRLTPELPSDIVTMFVDDANIATWLDHPNLARVLEVGRSEHCVFLVMEYVPGTNLLQLGRLSRRRGVRSIPAEVVASCGTQICRGLDAAHRQTDAQGRALNFVHGNLSPANVLCSYAGEAKLTNFDAVSGLSRASAAGLTPKFSYLSPEQMVGAPVDHRADVFGVGVILFELLCGQRLFVGDSNLTTLQLIRAAVVPSMRALNPLVAEVLEQVVRKALARAPDDRYQSARELADDLAPFLRGDVTETLSTFVRTVCAEELERERERFARLGLTEPKLPDATGPAKTTPKSAVLTALEVRWGVDSK